MNTLRGHVADYLRLRRGAGFKLETRRPTAAPSSRPTCTAAASNGDQRSAVAWARLPERVRATHGPPSGSAVVRRFARYLHAIDPATEVPPPGLFSRPAARPAPFLYSPADIVASDRRLRGRCAPRCGRRPITTLIRSARRHGHADAARRSSSTATTSTCDRAHCTIRAGQVREVTAGAPAPQRHRRAARTMPRPARAGSAQQPQTATRVLRLRRRRTALCTPPSSRRSGFFYDSAGRPPSGPRTPRDSRPATHLRRRTLLGWYRDRRRRRRPASRRCRPTSATSTRRHLLVSVRVPGAAGRLAAAPPRASIRGGPS